MDTRSWLIVSQFACLLLPVYAIGSYNITIGVRAVILFLHMVRWGQNQCDYNYCTSRMIQNAHTSNVGAGYVRVAGLFRYGQHMLTVELTRGSMTRMGVGELVAGEWGHTWQLVAALAVARGGPPFY
ncbi:hypothetical protein BJV82DRAFT_577880 [Fennellomyces sp. T-0311]|nr:hypothetical protein BJV82DRAFT_577880 [Fennellomyces sp. T-0311]